MRGDVPASCCPVCGSAAGSLISFGPQPSALGFQPRRDAPQSRHSLELSACDSCHFVFVPTPAPPDHFYGDSQMPTSSYPAEHLPQIIATVAARGIDPAALVVEIGCNDGYLLAQFRAAGHSNLLGVEPSPSCVALAEKRGLDVRCAFFSAEEAAWILETRGTPAVVLCRHVLEHVTRPAEFIEALAMLVRPGGLLVLEVPDLQATEENGDFSTVWEQHVGYFDASVLRRLLRKTGLHVESLERLPHGGGSLLAYVGVGPLEDDSDVVPDRRRLVARIDAARREVQAFVSELRRAGKTLAGFGAGMRGVMFLSISGTGEMLEFVVDDSPAKVGMFLPGARCPIVPSSMLAERPTDYCLILPLSSKSLERKVMERFEAYRRRGGRFIEFFTDSGQTVRVHE